MTEASAAGPAPSLRGSLIMAGAWLASHLPERPLVAGAESVGELWYRLAPARRDQARANLAARLRGPRRERPRDPPRRDGRPPTPTPWSGWSAPRSGTPPATTSRSPGPAPTTWTRPSRGSTSTRPTASARRCRSGDPAIIVGMHFGAIELPTVLMSTYVGHGVTAPMETVDDPGPPALVRQLPRVASASTSCPSRTRGGPCCARCAAASRSASSPIATSPTPGSRSRSSATRRRSPPARPCSRWRPARPSTSGPRDGSATAATGAACSPCRHPQTGTRRERIVGLTAAIAAAFESLLADAPEQWWGAFHPIWPDLDQSVREAEQAAPEPGRDGPWTRAPGDVTASAGDPTQRRGRADLHIHTLASDGTAPVTEILDHVEREAVLDVIAITDHERIDAALAARRLAEDRGMRVRVVVGEEISTRGGHLLGLFLERPVPALKSLRWSIAAVHEQGGIAIPAHPLVPYPLCAQGFVLRGLLDRRRSRGPPGRDRDVQPHGPRPLLARTGRPVRRRPRAVPDRQQRRPRAGRDRLRLDELPGPDRRRPPRRDPGRHHDPPRRLPRHGGPARDVRAAAAQVRPRRPGRGRRAAAARRDRARPRLPGRRTAGRRGSSRPTRIETPR